MSVQSLGADWATGRYEPTIGIVFFSLAGVLTQISVMSDFHNALVKEGVIGQLGTKYRSNAEPGEMLRVCVD